ncbi:ATP-binding cassette transporter [Clavulina sp. PMI_390]|nr:ATP-binding cassette transporter [Clavulina sp. PMI_390]
MIAQEGGTSRWEVEPAEAALYLYLGLLCTLASRHPPTHPTQYSLAAHVNVIFLATFSIYSYRNLWPLATYYLLPEDASLGVLTWSRIALLGWNAIIVPGFLPSQYVPVDPKNPFPPSPEQTASIMSGLLFSYMGPLVIEASKRPHLPFDDLPPLADVDRSRHLRAQTFPALDPMIRTSDRHVFFAFLKLLARSWFMLTFTAIIFCLKGFLAPIATYQLLHYVETSGQGARIKPWFWIIVLLCRSLLGDIALHRYYYEITTITVRAEAIITQLVFEHALRIRVKEDVNSFHSTAASQATTRPVTPVFTDTVAGGTSVDIVADGSGSHDIISTDEAIDVTPSKPDIVPTDTAEDGATSSLVGKINNLISSDLDNIIQARELPYILTYIPLKIALSTWFLYLILGWSTFVGMALMLAGFLIPGRIAALVHNVQIRKMKKTDERIQSITETVNLLRLVKMFGWERRVEDKLRDRREAELSWLEKYYLYVLMNNNVTWILPLMSLLGTYATFTMIMKRPLNEPLELQIFASLGVLESLREALFDMLQHLPAIVTAKVSIDRLDDFLRNTELLDEYTPTIDSIADQPSVLPQSLQNNTIGFKNAHFTWSGLSPQSGSLTPSRREFTLRVDEEIIFTPGCLNLIVGPTASGKSSLLLALLGELHYVPSGVESWRSLPRDGGISYCAQEPWILNETIKNNILFGRAYEEERYKQVLYQCALERDLELFDAGDETEVGERGLTLSGGQKARVSLARAVYSESSIVLLDDVLSALDVHTIKWIVDKCLPGNLLRGRTVLLVTHNLSMTRNLATSITTLSPNGSVTISSGPTTGTTPDVYFELNQNSEVPLDQVDDSAPVEAQRKAAGAGKLVAAEEVALGHVSLSALLLYFRSLGGIWFWIPLLVTTGSVDLVDLYQTWWLGLWGRMYEILPPEKVDVPFYLGIYSLYVLAASVLFTANQLIWIGAMVRSARSIHERLARAILSTTFRFLDKTPVGRIVQRFTKDIGSIDTGLPRKIFNVIQLTLHIAQRLVVIICFAPAFLLPSIILATFGVILGQYYIHAQLPVKREMSNARAPVFTVFGTAINGLTTIRAYGVQERFKDESLRRIDNYTRTARPFWNLNRWVGLRVDYMGGVYSAALAGYLLYVSKADATQIGFLLNVSLWTSELVLFWIRELNDVEVEGNSLERIQQYVEIEQEQLPSESGVPPASWPTSGALSVENLSARYSLDGPKVLQELTFTIKSGEKIGIVGRTGSGKSSLTLSLLRLIITEGEVYFDGLLTSNLNLEALRSAITIIPQQPELMSGSVRDNLDPFSEHDDAVLNDALRAAGLFSLQEDLKDEERVSLDTTVSSSGGNFSLGQRQILALARALVRRSRVLILDEATASMDHKTDALIQESLRTQFQDSTVITIAHRLHTIMDADRILVLDAGRLVEYDSPRALLAKNGGIFKAMVDGSGDHDALYNIAGV